jgi:hypothetical protein
MGAWGGKVREALVVVLAVAVVARVAWLLLGPLVPGLITVAVLGTILLFAVRGPRTR